MLFNVFFFLLFNVLPCFTLYQSAAASGHQPTGYQQYRSIAPRQQRPIAPMQQQNPTTLSQSATVAQSQAAYPCKLI